MSSAAANPGETTHGLQCTEVWNGNGAIDNGVSVPGIDVWISSGPFRGETQGGDIYYVSMCGEGWVSRFGVVDVAGHGARVGQIGRRLRSLMRKYINTLDLTRLARALNHDLLELALTGRYATALLTSYYAPTDHLIICNAGHPRPIHHHAGEWSLLDAGRGAAPTENLPLGIREPAEYTQVAVKLEKGDLVLMYTDSLIESMGADGSRLGERGLLDLLRRLGGESPHDLNHRVLGAVAAFRGGRAAEDDETLLVLHHNAADPPSEIGAELNAA